MEAFNTAYQQRNEEIAAKDAEIKELQALKRIADDDRTRASLKEDIELRQRQYDRLVDARLELDRLAAATTAQPPVAPPGATSTLAGGAAAGEPVLITFKKATVERTVTFTHMPSWLELCERVEEVFTELQAEAFSLLDDKLELSEPLWPGSVKSTVTTAHTSMTLQVTSKCKAFSSFKTPETWHVLDTATKYSEEDAMQFPMAKYEVGVALDAELKACLGEKCEDIITLAGQELALRCLKTDPMKRNKEACKRELISPVIYAAAALAGARLIVQHPGIEFFGCLAVG